MSRQTRIAALRRLAAPDSGATDNERAVAFDKIALLERKQILTRQVSPTFDPYKEYVVGWDMATGPDQHVNCRCAMPGREAWDEAEAWFQEALRRAEGAMQATMQKMVYEAFAHGSGSMSDTVTGIVHEEAQAWRDLADDGDPK